MNARWKKAGGIVLLLFLAYFVVRSPVESANAVRNIASQIASLANTIAVSLTTFIRQLF